MKVQVEVLGLPALARLIGKKGELEFSGSTVTDMVKHIVGRHGQCNPVGAFQRMHRPGSPWRFAGWLGVASGFVILSFYSVVGGWALSYLVDAINGFSGTPDEIAARFGDLVGSAKLSVIWHTVFMVLTVAIVAGGIQRGTEGIARGRQET